MAAVQRFCSPPTVGLSGQILRHAHHDTGRRGRGGGYSLSNISDKDFLAELGYGAPRTFVYFADRFEKRERRKKEREKEEMQLFFSEKEVALHLGYRPYESTAATATLSYEHDDKGIFLFSKQPDRLGAQPASCSTGTGGTADMSYCSTFVSICCPRQE